MDLSKVTIPQKADLLIAFADVQNFMGIARALPDPLSVFELLDSMAKIIIRGMQGSPGKVVKFIGDACLLIFPEDAVDDGMQTILALKKRSEEFLASRGLANKLRITAHFGEAAVGLLGEGPQAQLDVLGEAVNIASSLGHGEHRGRVVISPQVFRKLSPVSRRTFHRYTPPVVYLADTQPASDTSA